MDSTTSPYRRAMLRMLAPALLGASLAGAAKGGEVYYDVRMESVALVEQERGDDAAGSARVDWRLRQQLVPRVLLDSPGEAWLEVPDAFAWQPPEQVIAGMRLVASTEAGAPAPKGRLFLPDEQRTGVRVYSFDLAGEEPVEGGREAFLRVKAEHYEMLWRRDIPGGAWFRRQANDARADLGEASRTERAPRRAVPLGPSDVDETFALFTGGRAVAENLQLDRELTVNEGGRRTISVETLPSIDVKELDWKALIDGLDPERDALAGWIPADQHAVFFPSFDAMVLVADEADRYGTPVLDMLEPRSEDAGTRARYERQLCMELDVLARTFGRQAVRSVALTGSDPYLRTGTDVALLFECAEPAAVLAFVRARQAAASQTPGVEKVEGEILGRKYEGVRSAERRVCSYVVGGDGVVLVSNSLAQIRRLLGARDGGHARLADAAEYVFFRDRYAAGEGEEAAFFVLTDAAIRRWCGPRWRIAASRRTRAMATMMDVEAQNYRGMVGDAVDPRRMGTWPERGRGVVLEVDRGGVRSPEYGTTEFLTPILELDVERVTDEEREAYTRFRNRYQMNWQEFFDPIAGRLVLKPGQAALDLSVMPLILGSDYNELIELTRGANLAPRSGDPHEGTLFHWVMAMDPKSPAFVRYGGLAGAIAPDLSDPLSWIGGAVSVYAERDPFWEEWRQAEDPDAFIERRFSQLPLALHVDVGNPLKLAAFLTGLRAFSTQAVPGMLLWENRKHGELGYVRIAPSEDFIEDAEELQDFAIYYAALPGALVVTLREDLLFRAMERHAARKAGDPVAAGHEWLGEDLALHVERELLDALSLLQMTDFERRQKERSWANLPILNEWRRAFPDRDPVEVHEEVFHTRLLCPGGGRYVWSEDLQTMESTVFGCPERPLPGEWRESALAGFRSADFGLTFENDGLRARAVIEHEGSK